MKLTAKHKKAMLKGREKKISGLVLKIDKDTEIHADRYQYILILNSRNTYYTTLEDLFEDLFAVRVKLELIKNREKTLEEILKTHKKIAEWLKKIFRNIEKPEIGK